MVVTRESVYADQKSVHLNHDHLMFFLSRILAIKIVKKQIKRPFLPKSAEWQKIDFQSRRIKSCRYRVAF